MQRILTIYSFNFPFFGKDFEKIKYFSILEDLEKLFLYSEIFISKKIIKNNIFEKIIFKLKNYEIQIIFYKKNELYFIPKLEFNLYKKSSIINEKEIILEKFILKNIFEIFISNGKNYYIFNFNEKKLNYKNSEILTTKILEKSFKKYNYNYLQNFLNNTSNDYLQDFLMENKILRNSFYYLILLCFKNYQILLNTKTGEKELEKILKQTNLKEYSSHLILQKNRLKIIEKNILKNFIEYKYMLDKLFEIFYGNKKKY